MRFPFPRPLLPLCLVLALAACPAPDPGATVPPAPDPVRGGVLRLALAGDADSLDPHRATSPPAWFFARALHRGLLAFPTDGERPVPDLATRVPRGGAAGTRYVFALREGIRFEPGGPPMVAADVAASIHRLVRADAGIARALHVIRGARAFARGRRARITGVRTPDERTVVLLLTRRAPDLPWILAHPQAAVVPASARPAGIQPPARLAGLGPYAIERYQPGRRIVLGRRPGWSDDPVRGAYLDGFDARVGLPAGTALARLEAGALDLILDPGPPDIEPLANAEGVRVIRTEPPCVRYLFLNARVPPFDDRDVRLAVAHAVDRVRLPGAPDRAVPAASLLPPTVVGHRGRLAIPEDDERARAALARAGRRGVSARIVVADSPRDRAEARAIRRSLAAVNIAITIDPVDPATVVPLAYADPSARVPMGIATWCADWPGLAGRNVLGAIADPRARTGRAPDPIYAGIGASSVARALERAEVASRDAGRAWAVAAAAAARTGALVPLTYPAEQVALAPSVGGFAGGPMWPRGDPGALWLGAAPAAGA